MIFPDFLDGPQITDGDLVRFTFGDADLTLRLPVIPNYENRRDRVSSIKDFSVIEFDDWRHFGDDGECAKKIVYQGWIYEDTVSHDDIAECTLEIEVRKYGTADEARNFSLNSATFRSHHLARLTEGFAEFPETRPDWPSDTNNFFAKPIPLKWVDGLLVQLDLSARKYPVPVAILPLGRRYYLNISFKFGSLHYRDRKNPYSDDLLRKMSLDVFDEFLSLIRIDYSPEFLAIIESSNGK
ncbi:MAG TPA: hypothetical protein VIZ65_11885 [Cellvibrionaceae bacterium]